jgi:cold shock CspA family protein
MESTPTTNTVTKTTGIVKWFNDKTGFGFITALDGEHATKDIFTHYSTIIVSTSLYKYLVQGEYVEFSIVATKNDKHELQSMDITGIKGGPLMCETRSINNSSNYVRTERHAPQSK